MKLEKAKITLNDCLACRYNSTNHEQAWVVTQLYAHTLSHSHTLAHTHSHTHSLTTYTHTHTHLHSHMLSRCAAVFVHLAFSVPFACLWEQPSGCVTSAETILIEKQNHKELQTVLQNKQVSLTLRCGRTQAQGVCAMCTGLETLTFVWLRCFFPSAPSLVSCL